MGGKGGDWKEDTRGGPPATVLRSRRRRQHIYGGQCEVMMAYGGHSVTRPQSAPLRSTFFPVVLASLTVITDTKDFFWTTFYRRLIYIPSHD